MERNPNPIQTPENMHWTPNVNKLEGGASNDVIKDLVASAALAKLAGNDAQKLNILIQTLAECKPQDLNESRLCLQASNLYSEGMRYLSRANDADLMSHSEFYMKSALKLLRLHNETLEALMRYRRGGEQKVLVQHVNVNEGGKAIVANVTAGGCSKNVAG